MQRKTQLFLKRVEAVLAKVLSAYYPDETEFINLARRTFFKKVLLLVKTRGLKYTVLYVKTSRNCVNRVLSGEPLISCDTVSLDSRGIPKWISPIFDAENTCKIKILQSFLVSLRGITLPPSLDTSPITSPSLAKVDEIKVSEIRKALISLKVIPLVKKCGDFKNFHLSTKRGPFGQSILSSLIELTFLPHTLIADIKLLGGPKLSKIIEESMDRLDILGYHSVPEY